MKIQIRYIWYYEGFEEKHIGTTDVEGQYVKGSFRGSMIPKYDKEEAIKQIENIIKEKEGYEGKENLVIELLGQFECVPKYIKQVDAQTGKITKIRRN